MGKGLIYIPILRLRQVEKKILMNFDFGEHMYPYIEIIKELDRLPVTMRKGKKVIPKKVKTFEEIHLEIISNIKSKKVFVDLPVHLKPNKQMADEVIGFLSRVIAVSKLRTKYMIKLAPLKNKIVPVISTYYQRTGEANTISNQEKDLRPHFEKLSFRTFPETFNNDMSQIEKIAKQSDYLIFDLNKFTADPADEDLEPILERLKRFTKCHVIIARSAMSDEITNIGLDHGEIIKEADNSLLKNFKSLNGKSFADYGGIKKDSVSDGGRISPGFVFFDPTENNYYGYKGKTRSTDEEKLCEYKETIVPAVLKSPATKRMKTSGLEFLSINNEGWRTILSIEKGIDSGKSAAKFKGISINHYLHCMRILIDAGRLG